MGVRNHAHESFETIKEAAEKKKKSTITAESFEHQVASKMDGFFDDVFLPAMKRFVQSDLTYDDVKTVVRDPVHLGGQDQRRSVPRTCREFLQEPLKKQAVAAEVLPRDDFGAAGSWLNAGGGSGHHGWARPSACRECHRR